MSSSLAHYQHFLKFSLKSAAHFAKRTNAGCYITSLAEVKITQISLFSNTNWKRTLSPTPTPVPLFFVRDVSPVHSLSHNWCVCIHYHLDHKVLLDLGVL